MSAEIIISGDKWAPRAGVSRFVYWSLAAHPAPTRGGRVGTPGEDDVDSSERMFSVNICWLFFSFMPFTGRQFWSGKKSKEITWNFLYKQFFPFTHCILGHCPMFHRIRYRYYTIFPHPVTALRVIQCSWRCRNILLVFGVKLSQHIPRVRE